VADLSDIENVLVSLITQAVYPNGTGEPSVAAAPCKIYRGWPIPANLDADLAAGTINISVFPQDVEQRTTRYSRAWMPLSIPTAALTLTVSGETITLGGTPSSPLNAAAVINGQGFVYAVQPSDTLTTIATGLAALINVSISATSSAPVITIPTAKELVARVGTVGTIIRETKRQKRGFQITSWCPTPALRDTIVPPIDQTLCDLDFITLPDGSAGRILYERSPVSDQVERQGLYRRDLFYSVEYPTTETESAAQIVTELFNITGGLDPNAPALESFYI
jgi:hypothetical protein